MVKVVKSTVLNAPVEAVWDVLRDFNGQPTTAEALASPRGLTGFEPTKSSFTTCLRMGALRAGPVCPGTPAPSRGTLASAALRT